LRIPQACGIRVRVTVALLLDATIVRSILLPSVMRLLGR
jgi:uncharacterized membrane protein YdfJ with MMPL/SSD domain